MCYKLNPHRKSKSRHADLLSRVDPGASSIGAAVKHQSQHTSMRKYPLVYLHWMPEKCRCYTSLFIASQKIRAAGQWIRGGAADMSFCLVGRPGVQTGRRCWVSAVCVTDFSARQHCHCHEHWPYCKAKKAPTRSPRGTNWETLGLWDL